MPPHPYGVLKASEIAAVRESAHHTPHYQIHCRAAGTHFRVAVNVQSETRPSELLFLVDPAFRHPIIARMPGLPPGFTRLPPRPGGLALDYLRLQLFDPARMHHLPADLPG